MHKDLSKFGMENLYRKLVTLDGRNYALDVCDTGRVAPESFCYIRRTAMFNGFLWSSQCLVYSITDRSSLEVAVAHERRHAYLNKWRQARMGVLANKRDLSCAIRLIVLGRNDETSGTLPNTVTDAVFCKFLSLHSPSKAPSTSQHRRAET